jgi:predicted AAA+ superfamily ATPase
MNEGYIKRTAEKKIASTLKNIEDLPVWNTHIRSSAELRKVPKRNFCDVSLACAALNINREKLLADVNYIGYLFESMVLQNIRVYADANDAKVYYYRDSNADEIDIITQDRSGDWAGFEVKLSDDNLDDTAEKLLRISSNITKNPKSSSIIVGTPRTYMRPDGVSVISLASLGV